MIQLPVGLPDKVREWIKEQAEKNFMAEAAFVRQIIIEAMVKEKRERREEKI